MTNVKVPRRKFLHIAVGAAALPVTSRIARAQSYPSRPVRIVVPFAAGTTTDIFARLTGQWLSERFGRSFVIDNRPGAGGNIATEAVAKSPPDGYTLLMIGSANAIGATAYTRLNFNFIRDIAPVACTLQNPYLMVVSPTFSAKIVTDFIAYARTNPGKINMGSAGIGTTTHMVGELFKMMTGIEMVHVPNRIGNQLTDVITGHVHVGFSPLPGAIEQVRSGSLRALAITSRSRWAAMPDLPTVGESVPGFAAIGWAGIGTPRNTPAQIIEALNREIVAMPADPKMKARYTELGAEPLAATPAEFGKFVAEETEKWAKVVKSAGVQVD